MWNIHYIIHPGIQKTRIRNLLLKNLETLANSSVTTLEILVKAILWHLQNAKSSKSQINPPRKTSLNVFRVWIHVRHLLDFIKSVPSCLVSGSSWNLAGGFLQEKSESQQVLVCLLPASFVKKKKKKKGRGEGCRLQRKKFLQVKNLKVD